MQLIKISYEKIFLLFSHIDLQNEINIHLNKLIYKMFFLYNQTRDNLQLITSFLPKKN